MNQNDPFASPDVDKTIIMPSPGRRTPTIQKSSSYSQMGGPSGRSQIDLAHAPTNIGLNPLITAANPLFNATMALRTTLNNHDLIGLRDYFVQGIKSFENQAKTAGISPEKVIASRYALCTFIDESISSTPWGSEEWENTAYLFNFIMKQLVAKNFSTY